MLVPIQFIQSGGAAVITINYRDPRPIYEQIQTELRLSLIHI